MSHLADHERVHGTNIHITENVAVTLCGGSVFWDTQYEAQLHGVTMRCCLCLYTVLQLYSSKHAFNERLLALRDKKIQLVDEIGALVKELKQIQSILGPQMSKPLPSVPVIHPCETPEK